MAVRSVTRPVPMPRLDRRFVVAGLLAAVSAVVVLVLTRPPERTPVIVAAADLPAGHVLEASDVAVRYVEDRTGFVVGDSIGELAGYSLAVPMSQGEPLLASIVRSPERVAAASSMSLAVPIERAALGRLAAGDHIDIYMTTSEMSGEARTDLAAHDVYLIDAMVADEPGSRDEVWLLIAVDEQLARQLTTASHAGSLDVVKVES